MRAPSRLYILNTEGSTIFSLNTEDAVFSSNLIRLSDGRVAFFGRIHDWQTSMVLHAIDVQSQAWGESIDLPANVMNVFSGFDEYLVIVDDGVNLSGIHYETAEPVRIFNWAESMVSPEGLGNVSFLHDGRVLFTTATLTPDSTELITLSRTAQDDIPIRTTLRLATTQISRELMSAVAEFNRTNAFYVIEVNEININWDAPSADFTRLALDIITGNGPDIMVTTGLPFHQWAGQGLFVDLYELIDMDPTLSRDHILDVALSNAETNGRLYRIFPRFSVNTMVGRPDVVGSEPGWTMGELVSILEANPQATSPFGMGFDGRHIFRLMFMNSINNFVNWELGTVYFESDHFLELLEYAYRLHEALEWEGTGYFVINAALTREMLASGEQLVVITDIACFNAMFVMMYVLGEDFIIKGIPSEHGSGQLMDVSLNSLSISSISEHQEGAWEFIRMILSEGWQRRNIVEVGFPTNRVVFNERIGLALSGEGVETATWGGIFMYGTDFLPEDTSPVVNATLALIASTDGIVEGSDPLLDIVFETLDDLFRGQITTEDAARIIQNRAQTFVNEQN